ARRGLLYWIVGSALATVGMIYVYPGAFLLPLFFLGLAIYAALTLPRTLFIEADRVVIGYLFRTRTLHAREVESVVLPGPHLLVVGTSAFIPAALPGVPRYRLYRTLET